ncbi:MAG: T9SS type A sorting domain-containing protein [Niastella sp.]|uniref:T9SS type A sorting domain-containing protein n=1 Tax=Niastella sp. TaxID=1869183 RepID=UPI003899A2A7
MQTMIKNILPAICLSLCAVAGYGQFVDPSRVPVQSCHVNVNEFSDFRDDLKRAVFKFSTGTGLCSGTLVNRATKNQADVGQYFISAWHCFKSGNECGGSEFDFDNSSITLVFNYQSPDGQSLVFEKNYDGQLYTIKRKARLVEKVACLEGDFALCEILGDPIPPYFNVYYAGWYPNELGINANGQFSIFHHPAGSIKKVSAKDHMLPSTTPLKATCVTVTKVIDVLLGWIWKRKWSTQVICTYTEIPGVGTKYKITQYNYGVIEDGSSGGGLFTGQSGFAGENRLIGQLSASAPSHHCNPLIDVGISYFGKFANVYTRQSVKNTLNPQNLGWVDLQGIGGLQITCHPQITIDGNALDSRKAELYPASIYQPQNAITLTSQTTFVTNGSVTVKNGADFTFQAGNKVEFNDGFEVETGASFVAEINQSPCGINSRQDVSRPGDASEMKKTIQRLPLLKEKKFDISKYVPEAANPQITNAYAFNLYPNPSKGNINVELFFKGQEKNALVDLYDLYGHHVYSKKYSNIFFIKESLNLSLKNGMYNMIIRTDRETFTKKVVVAQ